MATGLENLQIYKLAKDLEHKVHWAIKKLPHDEKYGKVSQLKRSSSSVVDNIAESYGRYNYQEKIQFLYIARGSAEEARSQLNRACLAGPDIDGLREISAEYTDEIKQINGFIRYLRSKKLKQYYNLNCLTNQLINHLTT